MRQFINEHISNATNIEIGSTEQLNLENVDQYVIQCEHNQKFQLVKEIMVKAPLKCCIVFINTKDYLD